MCGNIRNVALAAACRGIKVDMAIVSGSGNNNSSSLFVFKLLVETTV